MTLAPDEYVSWHENVAELPFSSPGHVPIRLLNVSLGSPPVAVPVIVNVSMPFVGMGVQVDDFGVSETE